MGGREMYAAGTRALDQREVVTEGMEGLLSPGYELKPKTLPDLVPTLVYVTLAPFLEAKEAYEVAVG